jgi:large subunit ribosomal protein L7/L12
MSVVLDEKTQEIFEQITSLTFLQTANLVKKFEQEFGISAAAPVAVAAAAAGPVEEVEEQTEFTVILLDPGPNKIQVLKEVRALTGLGLKEAKDLVDNTPKDVKAGIKKDDAKAIEKTLADLGAKVEVK